MSTLVAASPLIGTAKEPKPIAPTKAANQPKTRFGSTMIYIITTTPLVP